MLNALFYVSTSNLHIPQDAGAIEEIVAVARSRNAALGISGALLFSETHFAQILEGSPDGIEELMGSIKGDPRHKNVDVILDGAVAERHFSGWSMAYAGPAAFVGRRIEPLIGRARSSSRRQQAARSIILMMSEFVSQAAEESKIRPAAA